MQADDKLTWWVVGILAAALLLRKTAGLSGLEGPGLVVGNVISLSPGGSSGNTYDKRTLGTPTYPLLIGASSSGHASQLIPIRSRSAVYDLGREATDVGVTDATTPIKVEVMSTYATAPSHLAQAVLGFRKLNQNYGRVSV